VCFKRFFSKKLAVPGAFYWPRFIAQPDPLIRECLALGEQCEALARAETARVANIPQPSHVVSAKHNLKTQEAYVPLQIPRGSLVVSAKHNLKTQEAYVPLGEEAEGPPLRCEYFARYGEDGHALLYLRGNQNIPPVAWKLVEELAANVPAVTSLGKSQLNWKMTLNLYKMTAQKCISGFPFHVGKQKGV
jgi:hypothetical protein